MDRFEDGGNLKIVGREEVKRSGIHWGVSKLNK